MGGASFNPDFAAGIGVDLKNALKLADWTYIFTENTVNYIEVNIPTKYLSLPHFFSHNKFQLQKSAFNQFSAKHTKKPTWIK